MQWHIEFLDEFKAVSIRYTGSSNADLFKKSFEECAVTAREKGARGFLVDTTALEPALTAGDIYEFPAVYDRLPVDRKTRFALLRPKNPHILKNLAFFETVCRNRGYIVKILDDRDSALKWLSS